jgi:hypothetical protein
LYRKQGDRVHAAEQEALAGKPENRE